VSDVFTTLLPILTHSKTTRVLKNTEGEFKWRAFFSTQTRTGRVEGKRGNPVLDKEFTGWTIEIANYT
jgi:hypothetical protein